MMKLLQPKLLISSIYELDISLLKKRGVRGLIMDLDNTLVAWNHPDASGELKAWLAKVRVHGLEMCIVSNNLSHRVEQFADNIGVMSVPKAAKPRRRSFRVAMRKMGTHHRNTAVIGDQVFTDILGGNRLKLFTILVSPISREEYWMTRIVRKVEHALVRGRLHSGA